jgi:hypothetical protein
MNDRTPRKVATARWLVSALSIGAAVLLTACGGDSSGTSGPPPVKTFSNPVGSYTIATVNATALPVAIFSDTNYTYEVTSGAITLTADGKYSATMHWRQTLAGKVDLYSDSTGGTWVLAGTTVQLVNSDDGSTDKADWANTGTLTFLETEGKGTDTYVYAIKK